MIEYDADDARTLMYEYWIKRRNPYVTDQFKKIVFEKIKAAAALGCGHCYLDELSLSEVQYLRSKGYCVRRHTVNGWVVSWIDLKVWDKIAD